MKKRLFLLSRIILPVLLLTACKKDTGPAINPSVETAHLLATIHYTDDVDNVVYDSLQYDSSQHLRQLKIIFTDAVSSGGFYYTYNRIGKQVLSKEYGLDNIEIPGTASTYTLNNQGFTDNRVYSIFDNISNVNLEYRNQFEYTPDNYLKKISNFRSSGNSLNSVFEFSYNNNNILDSISGYQNVGNSLEKKVVWFFQFDIGKKNTIGNSWMSSDLDDALNIGGKSQAYALSKETTIIYDSQRKRSLYQEDHYDNQYDDKGNIITRSGTSNYFQTDGSILDSLKKNYA